jgi:hypothetical protein
MKQLSLRSPSRVPYRTELLRRAPKLATYPDPPPVIPLPDTVAAQAAYHLDVITEIVFLPNFRTEGLGAPLMSRLNREKEEEESDS